MEIEEVLEEIKPIDLTCLIEGKDKEAQIEASRSIVDYLNRFGIVIVKDPRIPFDLNNKFIDMMEDYFDQPDHVKMSDVRPDLLYQVGSTPSLREKARNHCARVETLDPNHRPYTPCPPEVDPKWRYFWKIETEPSNHNNNIEKNKDNEQKEYVVLNSPNVKPKNFESWDILCNQWGDSLLTAAKTVAEGIALGFDLPRDYFVTRLKNAPHLLAPTASDLNKYNKSGTVLAGYHYDLNFLTVHGKSRYPGLFIWLRDNRKVLVKVPDGCLLCQAAKQLEWFTGGYIYAGFHEVVICDATIKAIERQKKLNRPLWRISSTFFTHTRSNVDLIPIEKFKNNETIQKYPLTKAGDQVLKELETIQIVVASDNPKV